MVLAILAVEVQTTQASPIIYYTPNMEILSIFSRKTPQELLKQNQRALQKASRDLDRERQKLEQQEKKLVQDIKKHAKLNQMGVCKVMARLVYANDATRTYYLHF